MCAARSHPPTHQMGDIAGIDVAHNIRAEQLKMGMARANNDA